MEYTYNEPIEGAVYRVVDETTISDGNNESFEERHDGSELYP